MCSSELGRSLSVSRGQGAMHAAPTELRETVEERATINMALLSELNRPLMRTLSVRSRDRDRTPRPCGLRTVHWPLLIFAEVAGNLSRVTSARAILKTGPQSSKLRS